MLRVDCLVAGAGVVGCGVALELARRGREVLVLERASVAAGASGGPGWRGVRANGRDPRELPLARQAYAAWPDLGYVRTGHLHLTEREGDRHELTEQVERQRVAGIPSELVPHGRLRELEPDLAEGVRAAVLCPLDGIADHTATTRRLAEAARNEGAEIRERTTVAALLRTGSRLSVVTDQDEAIEAHTTVLALNAGTVGLLDLPVFTVYPQVLITPRLTSSPVRHLIGHAHRRVALKTLPGGEVMITGGWLGQDGNVEPDQVAGNLAEAAAVYPALDGVEPAVVDAGRPESVARDMVPIVDLVPGADRAFIATGWSGHGWAIAPAIVALLAEWVTTGTRPGPLVAFGMGRFESS